MQIPRFDLSLLNSPICAMSLCIYIYTYIYISVCWYIYMFFCLSVCLSVYLIRKDEAIHIKCISAKQRVLLFLLVLCHGNRAVFPKPQLSKNNKNYCTARHETFRNHMGKYFHLLTHIVNIYIYIRDMMLKCIKQHSHAIGQRTGRV